MRQILLSQLRHQLRTIGISLLCLLLLGSLAGWLVIDLQKSLTSEGLRTILVEPVDVPDVLNSALSQFLTELGSLLKDATVSYTVMMSVFAVSAYLLLEAISFSSGLLAKAAIMPRSEWTWGALKNEELYQGKVYGVLILSNVVVFLVATSWGFRNRSEYNIESATTFFVNLMIVLTGLYVGFDYWTQRKWGILKYIASTRPSRTILLRTACARFFLLCALVFGFYGFLLLLGDAAVPWGARYVKATMEKVDQKFHEFKTSLPETDQNHNAITKMEGEIARRRDDVQRHLVDEWPREVTHAISRLKPTLLGIVLFFAFGNVYVPLIYAQVRYPLTAVFLVFLAALAIDYLLRGILPDLLSLGNGPTVAIISTGLGVVLGTVATQAVETALAKNVRGKTCWYCATEVPLDAQFCSRCRSPLARGSSERPDFLGNVNTRVVHFSACPFVARARGGNLVAFVELTEALDFRYCDFCLKGAGVAVSGPRSK